MSDPVKSLAALAVEFWKLSANFERQLQLGDEARRAGGQAQLRYSRRRLDALLEEQGLRAVFYDGLPWSPEIPASAVNADDLIGNGELLVESTIEPAVVGPEGVVLPAKVTLKGA